MWVGSRKWGSKHIINEAPACEWVTLSKVVWSCYSSEINTIHRLCPALERWEWGGRRANRSRGEKPGTNSSHGCTLFELDWHLVVHRRKSRKKTKAAFRLEMEYEVRPGCVVLYKHSSCTPLGGKKGIIVSRKLRSRNYGLVIKIRNKLLCVGFGAPPGAHLLLFGGSVCCVVAAARGCHSSQGAFWGLQGGEGLAEEEEEGAYNTAGYFWGMFPCCYNDKFIHLDQGNWLHC